MALPAEKARSLFKRLPAASLLLPGSATAFVRQSNLLSPRHNSGRRGLELVRAARLYRQALDDLRRGAVSKFRAKAKRLDNYPLRPYLDYHLVNGRLNRASTKEIRNFMDEHGDLAPSDIMFRRWLKKLGQKRHWTTLLQNFSDADYQRSRDAELRCYYVRALYGREQRKKALDWTTDLWLSPKSQPKACDPIFDVWRTTPRFTEEIAWQRFDAAIKNNQRKLSRYLLRFFTGTNKRAAEAYYQVHTQPKRITKRSRFARDNAKNRSIIQHGLMRLSRNGAEDAAKAWRAMQRPIHLVRYSAQSSPSIFKLD